jgi:4-diphosphocytidyl-2-C-methyl-D-erythritol kinase
VALRRLARAKINLSLRVTGRRADGYHLLDSVVAFADVGDWIEVRPASGFSLTITGPFAVGLSAGPDNLVARAAQALAAAAGCAPDVAITLEKHLPIASGIGGGSADAAATLVLLQHLWGSAVDLAVLGADLGADVPVCLKSQSCRMSGVGDVLHPIVLPPTRALLVNPGVTVETAAVFRARTGPFRATLDHEPATVAELVRQGGNDLTEPAISLAPEIATVLAALNALPGVRAAAMSGSGATCFALLDDPSGAAATLRAAHPEWWYCDTVLSALPGDRHFGL